LSVASIWVEPIDINCEQPHYTYSYMQIIAFILFGWLVYPFPIFVSLAGAIIPIIYGRQRHWKTREYVKVIAIVEASILLAYLLLMALLTLLLSGVHTAL
jgi:hypothetical protein